jgi:hypothetical protein
VEDAAGLAAGGGFFAGALELDHLGEAMPGDLLEARARLTEVRETRCCLAFTVVNQSRGGLRIAAGRARYRRYAGAGLDAPPLALGEQLAPAGMLTPDA